MLRPSALLKTLALFGTIAGTAAALFAASRYLPRDTIEDATEDDFLDETDDQPTGKVYAFDYDKDGEPDGYAADTTGDGKLDTVTIDTTGDGVVDTALIDSDGDGQFDTKVDLASGETEKIENIDLP